MEAGDQRLLAGAAETRAAVAVLPHNEQRLARGDALGVAHNRDLLAVVGDNVYIGHGTQRDTLKPDLEEKGRGRSENRCGWLRARTGPAG